MWVMWVWAMLVCAASLPPKLESAAYPKDIFPEGPRVVPEAAFEAPVKIPWLGPFLADLKRGPVHPLDEAKDGALAAQCLIAGEVLAPYWARDLIPERPRDMDEIRNLPWSLWTLPKLKKMERPLVVEESADMKPRYKALISLLSRPGEFGVSTNEVLLGENLWFSTVCVTDKGWPFRKLIKDGHIRASASWNERYSPSLEEAFKSKYWASVTHQVWYAARGYVTLTRGKIPKTIGDLEKVGGPRNPDAWNPVIEAVVKESLKAIAESPQYAGKE
jgi:hypothetical protein